MITIGIPCYNQADYVEEAILSAINQQSCKVEILFCDDGSTDNSLEIAKTYKKKIKIISQVNKGLPSARNTLIMNMKGDYFLPLDADDILMPNCVAEIEKKIKETQADIIAPSFETFEERESDVILNDGLTVESFKENNRIGYFSAIKKTALLQIGGYNPKMRWGWEDYDLWIDLLKRGRKIAVIKQKLVRYRVKKVSMITESNKHSVELRAQMKVNHPEIYGI